MSPAFIFLAIFAAIGIMNHEPQTVATLRVRWEQPSADWNATTNTVGVTEKELYKALASVNSRLAEKGVDVNFGYYPAQIPSHNPAAVGRLWIDGAPVETLIADDLSLQHDVHAIKAKWIVKAALIAGEKRHAAAEAGLIRGSGVKLGATG